ncbi:hypothetical protein ACWD04_27405 [Streptomyces sp. NPDC002911]
MAGLLYGALRPTPRLGRRLLLCLTGMAALMSLPLIAAAATESLLAPAGCLLLARAATAPTMVTGMTLIQRLTPPAQISEGMTRAVAALLGGMARVRQEAAGWWNTPVR